jgi:hypothetical protein
VPPKALAHFCLHTQRLHSTPGLHLSYVVLRTSVCSNVCVYAYRLRLHPQGKRYGLKDFQDVACANAAKRFGGLHGCLPARYIEVGCGTHRAGTRYTTVWGAVHPEGGGAPSCSSPLACSGCTVSLPWRPMSPAVHPSHPHWANTLSVALLPQLLNSSPSPPSLPACIPACLM